MFYQAKVTRGLQWLCMKHLDCRLGPVLLLKGSANHPDNHHCARVVVSKGIPGTFLPRARDAV